MRQNKTKKRTQNDYRRDFHSLERRPSSNGSSINNLFSEPKTERSVKKSQSIKKGIITTLKAANKKKVMQNQAAKKKKMVRQEDLLYDTRDFDIVDIETVRSSRGAASKRHRVSAHMRAITVIIISLIVFFVAALIGIFLIFKVETIDVIGESKYSREEIIAAAGYSVGDNLFFLPVQEVEESLPKRLPYIESAKITREIPHTISIDITPSSQAAVLNYEGNTVVVDGDGKVIDITKDTDAKGIKVFGVEILKPKLSSQVVIKDEEQNDAFYKAIGKLKSINGLKDMSSLDLNDLEDIVLTYQDRIKMDLGSVTRLPYKIQFGFSIVNDENKIMKTEYGVLDLTLRTDVNKARFMPEYDFSQGSADVQNADSDDGSLESNGDVQIFAINLGRGDDIPDKPYTGSNTSDDDQNDETDDA